MRPIRRQLGNAGGVSGRNAGGVAKAASVTAGVGGEAAITVIVTSAVLVGGGAAITVIVTSAVVAGVDFTVLPALLSGAGRGQPAGGGGNNGHGLGLELLRKPSGIQDCDGALNHRNQERCAQLVPKACRQMLGFFTILTVALKEEAEAVLLHQPLLQLDRARAELTMGG